MNARKSVILTAGGLLLGGCASFMSTETPRADARVLANNLSGEPHVHCSRAAEPGRVAVFSVNSNAISLTLLDENQIISKQKLLETAGAVSALKSARADGGWYLAWLENAGEAPGSWKFSFVTEEGRTAWTSPVSIGPVFSGRFPVALAVTAKQELAAAWNDTDPTTGALYVTHALIGRDGVIASSRTAGRGSGPGAFYQGPALAPDAEGGYYLAFRQADRETDRGIVLGRYSPSGELLWPDFFDVPDNGKYASPPFLVSDGSGGVLVAWEDGRAGNMDIFAQKVSNEGKPLWDERGVGVAVGKGNQWSPRAAMNGNGGFYFAWLDDGTGSQWRTVVQNIGPNGAPRWDPSGISALPSDYKQYDPDIETDGDKLIATWEEARWGLYQVFAQEFSKNGQPLLGQDGYLAAQAQCSQKDTSLASAKDGAIGLAWKEFCGEKWKAAALVDNPLK